MKNRMVFFKIRNHLMIHSEYTRIVIHNFEVTCRIYDAGVLFGGLFAIDPHGRVGFGYIFVFVIHCFLLFSVLVFSTTDGFCDQLSLPVNGTLDTTFTRFGTTVTFGCFPGFELEGAKKTQCVKSETHTSGFKWDSVAPICTGNSLNVRVLLLTARALHTLRQFHSANACANRNCTCDRL